tara:strand:+ start:8998 stop:9123 length:126 start_codon:yes stop_codon:yes gene_type:complete
LESALKAGELSILKAAQLFDRALEAAIGNPHSMQRESQLAD